MMPSASVSIGAVPPQMGQLLGLLGLEGSGAPGPSRVDLDMGAMLPSISGQAWLHSVMSSAMPGLPFNALPRLMSMTAQMSAVGANYPMQDPRALLAELQRTLRSLRAHLLPFFGSMPSISRPHLTKMSLAARMTLDMRAKGLCPLALSGVDMSFSEAQNLGNPQVTFNATIGSVTQFQTQPFPAFGLPLPKLNLAMSLAALAPLADVPQTLGLPVVSDPGFCASAMALLDGLVDIPPLPLDVNQLMADLSTLSGLASIHAAFGADALSPTGIIRVQDMLNYFARLGLPPLPSLAVSLQPKLDMLPSLDTVTTGYEVARSGAATFALSTRFDPKLPLILPFLTALDALQTIVGDAFGAIPMGACNHCRMPI